MAAIARDPPLEAAKVFGGLVTRSTMMGALLARLEQLALTETSVLIEGETGVGKELAAESMHRASGRQRGPFLVFDCAAKSLAAAELELFGADESARAECAGMPGILELAEGGTVLLDHVDELAPLLQARLLRALERRQLRRVGGSRRVELDLRVLAACAHGLSREVRRGAFQRELLAYIGAERVHIPPLRQRLIDLLPLSEALLSSFHPPSTLSAIPAPLWAEFEAYAWPGNVRELRNALQRALVVPDRALRFGRAKPA